MRSLFESINDTDKTVLDRTSAQAHLEDLRHWVEYATSGKCEEGRGWYFDPQGHIHIVGACPTFVIDKKLRENDRYLYAKIVEFEPSTVCICKVTDPDMAEHVLPVQLGKSGFRGFKLVYDVKGDLEPRHFPMFTCGSISVTCTGHLNLCIMPNCTEDLYIHGNKASKVTYPAGFPSDVKKINVYK